MNTIVPAGAPWSGIVRRGQVLRITDLEGQQAVDFLCYNAADPQERYHAPNTVKAAGTIFLTTGHKLYSDVARPMFTIVEDQFGGHDTIGGWPREFPQCARDPRPRPARHRAQHQLVHARASRH